jgi:hypothetical protein
MRPKPGDVVLIASAASVQFGGGRSLIFRVIRVHDWVTYDGWIWLGGYVLTERGVATDRRDIFVQVAGIRPVTRGPQPPGGRTRWP